MSNTTSGQLEIVRVPFSRMLKSEVAEYAKRATNIAEKHHIEGVLINPVIEELSRTSPQIVMLGVRYGIDPMREDLSNLRSQLMLAISALKLKVRIFSKTKNDKHLRVADSYINTYLRYLDDTKNEKELIQRVEGFTKATDSERALTEAIESHELNKEVGNIKMIMSDLNATWHKRVTMLAERPNVETKDLVRTISTAVENLFKAIEVAPIMSPEEDHTALVQELSQLSDMFIRSMDIRRANNQRKANKGKEGDTGAEGAEGTEGAEGAEGTNSPIEEDNETQEGANPRPMATAVRYANDWREEEEFMNSFEVENTLLDETNTEELGSTADVVDEENQEGEEGAIAVE